MYEIFEQLLQEKGVKAADVTRATGISSTVFSEWKKGKSTPKADKRKKIADYFGVSLEYLDTGIEPQIDYLYTDENVEFLIEISRKSKSDLNRIKKLLEYYYKLSDVDKDVVDKLVKSLSVESKEND